MKKPLLIYGAGGLGREILSLLMALDEFEVKGYLDDLVPRNTVVNGVKVLGGEEVIDTFEKNINLVLAFGDPVSKALKAASIGTDRVHYPVIIHPTVVLQNRDSITIGAGTVLCSGTVLTTDIIVGDHALINLNCTIGHDARIGNYSSLMPGVHIAGEVVIGNGVLIGSGTTILNRITLGDNCKIGMGSAVINDVDAGMTVAGVPAKPILAKSHSKYRS